MTHSTYADVPEHVEGQPGARFSVELHQQLPDTGKQCSGCRRPMPALDLHWADQYGWLWCDECARHCADCTDADCDHPRAVLIPWAADYHAGYTDARSDVLGGYGQREISGRPEAYRHGCRRSFKWHTEHQAGAR